MLAMWMNYKNILSEKIEQIQKCTPWHDSIFMKILEYTKQKEDMGWGGGFKGIHCKFQEGFFSNDGNDLKLDVVMVE